MNDNEWVTLREKDKPKKTMTEAGEDLKDVATSTILLCLANNTRWKVLSLTDPADILGKLESQYKSKLLTSSLHLKKRLFGLQMTQEPNFNQHLDEFNKLMMDWILSR